MKYDFSDASVSSLLQYWMTNMYCLFTIAISSLLLKISSLYQNLSLISSNLSLLLQFSRKWKKINISSIVIPIRLSPVNRRLIQGCRNSLHPLCLVLWLPNTACRRHMYACMQWVHAKLSMHPNTPLFYFLAFKRKEPERNIPSILLLWISLKQRAQLPFKKFFPLPS